MAAGNPWPGFALAIIKALACGRLAFPGGHRPPRGHVVGAALAGVGVAASEDPAVDDHILGLLRETGLRHVRLDFAPEDSGGPTERLLRRLCAEDVAVTLHLVQSPAAARRMPAAEACDAWRGFVAATLDRHGACIEMVELGSTVNRRRWCGHSLAGFLAMWEIGWRETRARGLTLAGPSVTDFEPFWNIGLLALLAERGQLPDIHADNLFSERCTEPERFDNKVFGRSMVSWSKYNLVKKARLLQRTGADHGVPRLVSPAAFWTLPRIERYLPDSEEKQADYLARYLLLCAASGALERAWWGPLICHREGLVDNGARPYPALERITHYARVEGGLDDLRVRPALHALRAFVGLVPGARYEGRLDTGDGLEVHAFRSRERLVHAVWTINGRAAALPDLYSADDLAAAVFLDRDGSAEEAAVARMTLVGEAPRYLCWPADRAVALLPGAALLPDVAIAWHQRGKRHFLYREGDWRGVICAASPDEMATLLRAIDPHTLVAPARADALRHARNAVWAIDDPRREGTQLVVKQPVKMYWHKKLLDRFKPSKALRSWNGTAELRRRGIAAAPPVAYFEHVGDDGLMRNLYVCERVAADCSVRELFSAHARGEDSCAGIAADEAYRQLCDFLLRMHGRGILFRDLSGGNILVRRKPADGLEFTLIDTARIRVYPRPLRVGERLADLVRACYKLDWAGRSAFMGMYMAGLGKPFESWHKLPFLLYDLKAALKRNAARKWLRRRLFRY